MATTVSELQVVVSADTSKAETGLSSLSSKLGSVGSTMALAFGGAAIAGVAAVGAGLASATGSAASFEKQMSAIKAVSGSSAAEMAQLSELALKLGADTSFSATEAAQGIEELVKAGVSIGDVMGGGAAAALNLAAAGAVSVKDAAELTSNALNAFGLSGADAAKVADTIAGAANASAIDVGEFKFSLAAVGAVANAVGMSFDDTATAIAVMGQAGIKGSDAGTSLKTMLLNLQPTTKAQTSLFRELGIVTADGSNRFFDAQGNAKSFGEIAEILKTSLGGLTKQQQLMALETMFGSDAIRAGAVFLDQGAEGFDKMAESMSKVTAEAVAQERLNNLAGVWEQFKGALETAAITLGMKLLPPLTELLKWGDSAISGLIPTLGVLGEQIGSAMSDGITRAKDLFRQLSDAWRTVKQVFGEGWEPSAEIEPLALAAGNAATKIKDLVDGVRDLVKWLGTVASVAGRMGAWDNFASGFGTLATEMEGVGDRLGDVAEALGRLNSASSGADTKVRALAAAVKIVGVAFELTSLAVGQVADTMLTFIDLSASFIRVFGQIGQALDALKRGDIPGFNTAMKGAAAAVSDFSNTGQGSMDRMSERARQGFGAIASAAGISMPATKETIESNLSAANQAVGENSAGMAQFMEANGAAMTTAAETAGQGVATATETGMAAASADAATSSAAMASAMETNGAAMAAAAETAGQGVATATETGMSSAVGAVQTQGPLAVAAAENMGTGMAGAIEAAGPAMASAAGEGGASAVAALQGQQGAASSAGSSVGSAMASGLEGGILSRAGAIASAAAGIVRRALAAARAAIGGGDDYDGERAYGGPVRAGGMYLVGERGPELFTPNVSGTIVPNNRLDSASILPMAASSGGSGSLQTIRVVMERPNGQEAEVAWITGYKLLARSGGLPSRFGDPA